MPVTEDEEDDRPRASLPLLIFFFVGTLALIGYIVFLALQGVDVNAGPPPVTLGHG